MEFVKCLDCNKDVSLKIAKKQFRTMCNHCSIAYKQRIEVKAIIDPILAVPTDQLIKNNEVIKIKCPNCSSIHSMKCVNLLRKKNEKTFGWCRKCVINTPERKEALIKSLKGRVGKPKTQQQKEHLSKLAKENWLRDRDKYVSGIRKNWQDQDFRTRNKIGDCGKKKWVYEIDY